MKGGDWTRAPTQEELGKMAQMSPLSKIGSVKAPTLLLLGTQDRRVPMSQGQKYYELLKHRGVPTKWVPCY